MSREIEMRKLAEEREEREGLLETGSPVKPEPVQLPAPEPTLFQTTMDFCFCAGSLQVSYILWGLMQEMIMSTKFNPTPSTPDGLFPSATFCVFSNRFLAIIVSLICCLTIKGTTTSAAPLLAFTPCALSNTISSWGQYQALVFVSFSLQTIFKSMKIIPVMLMGTILKGTVYKTKDYIEAFGITVGILIFSVSKANFVDASLLNQMLGFGCLTAYIIADSFTSQWQSRLYRDYGKIEHYQMMFGVNVSAIALTSL
jgi:adenosine 3'-phospho 5'-phosphosulfate transporter B2